MRIMLSDTTQQPWSISTQDSWPTELPPYRTSCLSVALASIIVQVCLILYRPPSRSWHLHRRHLRSNSDRGLVVPLTGTSIWDVVQLCVRMCIEQGLHQPPRRQLPLLEEQLQRRVFWECYMINRYSSSTLDRPFAIADQDITTALPAHVDDADLAAASALYPDLTTFETSYTRSVQNEMTVFLACVRLRQIT